MDEMPASGEEQRQDDRGTWHRRWQKLRPWIVPSFGSVTWKSRLRAIGLRIVFWYVAIIAAMAFFQRDLIYHPGRATIIRAADAQLPPGYVHDIVVETEDGILLHGWHILPAGGNCETREQCDRELQRAEWLVLFFHGNGGDRRGREFDSLSFTALGANVFLFDYRGYGENEGKPTEEGLAADARAVWEYSTGERGIPPQRIVIYGESLGGGVATGLVARLCAAGTPPAGLILGATFSSMTDTAASHYPWLPVRMVLLDRYPSDENMAAIDCPVLQMHGRHDDIVPIDVGRKLFAAVRQKSASGVPKTFIEFTAAAHNDFSEGKFQSAVGTFLDRIK
jgi:hypothetical protein